MALGLIPMSIMNFYQVQTSTSAEGGNLPTSRKKNGFYVWPACFVWNSFYISFVKSKLRLYTEEMLTWMIGVLVASGIQTGFDYCH